jgi:nucleotide-binding universal stress UspA family protein
MNTHALQRILVAIDLSQSSLNALDTAVALAQKNDSELRLLHVEDQFFTGDPASAPAGATTTEILQALCTGLRQKHQIRTSFNSLPGFVSAGIVQMSNEWQADLIVMGTHGASGYRQLFIGSNAYTVFKNASCPVLTVPSSKKWTGFKKILFPVRPIPGALQKYSVLRNFIDNSSQLEVMGLSVNKDEDDTELVTAMVKELSQQFSSDDTRFSASVNYGNNIAEDILRKCNLSKTDLLVLSSSIDISRNHFFIGPHSQQIINQSKIPVLHLRKFNGQEAKHETVGRGSKFENLKI